MSQFIENDAFEDDNESKAKASGPDESLNESDDDEERAEEAKKKKSAEFARLLDASFNKPQKKLAVGDKIRGEILVVGKEEIFVSTGAAGVSSDGIVPRKELLNPEGKFDKKVGDFLDLYVTQIRRDEIYLSPHPTAKNLADDLEDAFDMMLPVEGKVTEICKGGVRVTVLGKPAFCPISQLDLARIEDAGDYVGKRFEFRITQYSEGGRNIVLSRRKLLEEQRDLSEGEFAESHQMGDVVPGKVMRIEPYGAFVEVRPGVEGLAHISELSWSRIAHPEEILTVGQLIQVKILKTESNEGRLKIALSLKQAGPTPWENLPAQIKVGQKVEGKVTRCMKFGAFVEVAPGLEGLIPLSEMSSHKRVHRSDQLVREGEQVWVMIKEINLATQRILLSLKDAQEEGLKEYDAESSSESWRDYNTSQASGSFGTLADKFKGALEKKKKPTS